MARAPTKWTDLGDGRHPVPGARGLYLQVRGASRSWIWRGTVDGVRRDIGLGSLADVGVSAARQKADALRQAAAAGESPKTKAPPRAVLTLDECLTRAYASRVRRHKTDRWIHWSGPVRVHLADLLARPAGSITGRDVITAIEGIIEDGKHETARKAFVKVCLAFDVAVALGESNTNPARAVGKAIAWPRSAVEHHPAIAAADAPAVFARLLAASGSGAAVVAMAMLTGGRSGEVRGMTAAEVDLDSATWTVPAARTKTSTEWRVPLSAPAIALIERFGYRAGMDVSERPGTLFPGARGGVLTDMAALKAAKAAGLPSVHGARSLLVDWLREAGASFEVQELSLNHSIGGAVRTAYARADLLDERRAWIEKWGAVLCTTQSP